MDAVTVESRFRVDGKAYLPDLKKLVVRTEDDLRVRSGELADVHADLTEKYNEAVRSERTLETFESWRDQYLTQVAVGWILSCVFLRYLEDNALIEEVWLAGVGERLQQAHDRHQAFFQTGPTLTDRDYLLHAFETVAKLPGCGELFGKDRNPLWLLGPSGDMAKEILLFFQSVDPASGKLLRTFGDPHSERIGEVDSRRIAETRFLGDLYQDLSEAARKRYALLQTPDFVEEFILDRTLEPAIDLFGIDEVRMLDPTCGSGHFLLGSFARLLERRHKEKPSENERDRVQKALDGVYGVDLNPFAVAIARFRLLVAALEASGISKLKNAPNFKIHVAAGDSLLYGRTGQGLLGEEEGWKPDLFAVGDYREATDILSGQYHAVVGNPPYIVDKDKAHNNTVRKYYESCHRQFSLAVPFKELFFQIAVQGSRPGFIGMITANSFMKREFGTVLIEKFFPKVDLTHVIDTSGAYIPGHGTPTVILLGRSRKHNGGPVRAALGIRGEPSTPDDPARGKVWSSIVELLDKPGQENEFLSVSDVERDTFHKHPWSLGGGGAGELKELIERAGARLLEDIAEKPIGRAVRIAEEQAFMFDEVRKRHSRVSNEEFRGFMIGESVRDWSGPGEGWVWYPYPLGERRESPMLRNLWPWKLTLANRSTFQGKMADAGLEWFEYMQHTASAYKTPLSITFAEVATHNHFVLDRGGKVFKQTAPVIKLPAEATVDDHLALLGLLNSSVANFWARQVFFNKGGDHVGTEGARIVKNPWEDRVQRDGTKLGKFPLVPEYRTTIPYASSLDALAKERQELMGQVLSETPVCQNTLAEAALKDQELFERSVSLQEELDWLNYELYSLIAKGSSCQSDIESAAPIRPGERAFEIVMARRLEKGEEQPVWFERHGIEPVLELPKDWSQSYRAKVQARIDLIESHRDIALLESPVHKNRWQRTDWDTRLKEALAVKLLTHIENIISRETTLTTTAALTDRLRQDADFVQVAELYAGRDDLDLFKLVTDLVMSQDVPYLSTLRYKEPGLRKREQWEATWELQRREDAGEHIGKIPVPPKYGSGDFLKSHYWTHRGKLDVPKERFISYPLAEKESDSSPVIGWAGWNHAQQAQALASYLIERREDDSWTTERLTPLLAGLLELLPWLKQWHNDIDPDMGVGLGDFYQGFLEDQTRQLALTEQHLRDWRPPAKTKGGGRKKKG